MLTKNQQNNIISAYSTGFTNFLKNTNNNLSSYYEESKMLQTLIQNHPQWILIWLKWPRLKVKKFFNTILKRFFGNHWINLFELLLNDGYLMYLETILKQIKHQIAKLLNIKIGAIYTVFLLDEKQIQAITIAITNYFNCKVELNNYIDLQLIGGVLVKIANQRFDNSISYRLKKMQTLITNNYEN